MRGSIIHSPMRVYLDNNATTPLAPEARERLLDLFAEGALNPGSPHEQGRRARELFDAAEAEILETLDLPAGGQGLPGRVVVFCGSATEALNIVIRGRCREARPPVALSAVEHPAVAATAAAVGAPRVVNVSREGELDLAGLRDALGDARGTRPALAAFMFANNESGGLLPVEEIGRACRAADVPFLLDACQAPGKCEFFPALRASDPDYLVFSGHKMHGPVGVAALVMRRELADGLRPLLSGGGQGRGLRPGTEAVPLACALATALRVARSAADIESLRKNTARLWEAIRAAAPTARLTIPAAGRRLANTLHYRIPGLTAQRQVVALDLAGVECSSASACESGAAEPSKVMLAMGYSRIEAAEGIRLSISRFTSAEEIAFACEVLSEVLGRLPRGKGA